MTLMLRRAGRPCLLLAVLWACAVQADTYHDQQHELVRASRAVSALGPNLFGDKINHYTGALEFVQLDVSLPGNDGLGVGVGRRLVPGYAARQRLVAFGNWDLELPRIQGTFSSKYGWSFGLGKGTDRCSNFTGPGTVTGTNGDSFWDQEEYWKGHQLYVPGAGADEILKVGPTTPAVPADGQSYPLVTRHQWALRCTALASNAFTTASVNNQGEGFIARSPDGVTWRFDWLVRRKTDVMYRASPIPQLATPPGKVATAVVTPSLLRDEVWLLPTEARDRFGNTVSYAYDPTAPWRLQTITGSDGRAITLSYGSGSDRVTSITDGTRSWTYSYSSAGELLSVTQPDGSLLGISGADTISVTPHYSKDPGCAGLGDEAVSPFTGVISFTHPSGATGSFTVQPVSHARSYVPQNCFGDYGTFARFPRYFATTALTAKQIGGPGLPTLSWTYSYSSAANQGSWSDCSGSCPETKTVTVDGSDGRRLVHVFGTRVDRTEGQLLRLDEGPTSGGVLRSTASSHRIGREMGISILQMGDSASAVRTDPLQQRTITQQGTSFSWSATAFDSFERVTSQQRSGPGGSLSETLSYEDKLGQWVLGQLKTLKAAGLTPLENRYDSQARLVEVLKYGISQGSSGYNSDGTLAWRADGAGRRTNFSSYRRGLPQGISYPDGGSESAAVNNLGLITSLTDAAGYTTGYGYDSAGRLASITPPGGWTPTTLTFERVSSPEYGLPANHWRQTISQGNARTIAYYDGFWRPLMTRAFDTTQEASSRKVVVKGYDSAGQLAFESYPQRDASTVGITSPGRRMTYDALGRLLRTEADSELGVLTSTQAYLSGFQTQTTNPRNKTSTQSFWALDKPEDAKLASASLPAGVTVTITRDAFGKPTSISRGGVTRRYVYDAGQRLCKTLEPEVNATVQDYDLAGNLSWKAPGQNLTLASACDTLSVPAAAKISYGYDPMNRLTSTGYGDGSPGITREYWPDGKLKTVSSNGSSWSYAYNSLRLISTETLSYAGQSWAFSWGYSPNGHLASLSYPAGGPALSYAPNALGEPSQVGSFATGLSFHPNGAVNSFRFGNGIQHTLTLNLRGLPQTNEDVGVMKDAYAYDANGNVNSISDQQESVFSRSMGYDDLDRLTSASAPGVWGAATYTYDVADNLKTANVGSRNVTLNYTDGTNRLNSVTVNGSTSSYSYDPYGNIRSKGAQTYSFDLGNRMSASSLGGSYVYDGLGRRIKVQSSDGSTRLSLYSQAGQLLWSTSSGGSRPASSTAYVYLAGKAIAEVNSASGTQYVHTDALGSPVAHTGPTGTLLNRTRYEPYGYVAAGTKPGPATSLMGYTGHVQDPETELVYMQQRYYDPIAGRFLSIDPIVTDAETGKRFGLYTYVGNNPYAKVDPDGRDPTLTNAECRKMGGCEVVADSGSSAGSSGTSKAEGSTGYQGLTMVNPMGDPEGDNPMAGHATLMVGGGAVAMGAVVGAPALAQGALGFIEREGLKYATRQAVKEFSSNELAMSEFLSVKEMAAGTRLAAANYGKAVERYAANYVARSPVLSRLLNYTSRPFTRSPDFASKYGERVYDITTKGTRWAEDHLRRGYDGMLTLIQYVRP